MKNISRTNQLLAVLLVVQLIVVGVVFWPRGGTAAAPAVALLEGLDASQVVRIAVKDSEGGEVVLEKKAGAWVLPNVDDYPCEEKRVTEFLDKVAALQSNRLVTENSTSHRRLRVADDAFERQITMTTEDGTNYILYLGTSPAYNVTHARRAGQNQVYLVSGINFSDASTALTSWLNAKYFSVPQDQVTAFTVQNAQGTFRFRKDEAGKWSLEGLAAGETLDENTVKVLLGRLEAWWMMEPLGKTEKPEYGFDQPSAVITVEAKDEAGGSRTYTVTVGARQEDNSYVIRSSESPYYVRVSAFSAEDFVNKGRQDFLVQPTPTPAPTDEAPAQPTPAS
ncbi:MAG: DUF4340 domain-containing protein [Anaerolineae bacterium]|nr:DUF4340 domain-containing protein [Anaerolineae bacterium]